jgi:hypothetical protein
MQANNQSEDEESEDILTISTRKSALTPSKSRKTSVPFKTLPTPAKSSQPAGYSLGSCCPIAFGTLLTCIFAEGDVDSEGDLLQSALKDRSTQRGKLFGAGIDRHHEDSSDGSAPEEPVITPSKRKINTPKGKARAPISVESEDEDEILGSSARVRTGRSSASKSLRKSITISDDNEYTAKNESDVSGTTSHACGALQNFKFGQELEHVLTTDRKYLFLLPRVVASESAFRGKKVMRMTKMKNRSHHH